MFHYSIRHLFLLLLLTTFINSSSAQNFEPIFKNISDELPSAEVYAIYQDSIGYMWFTTDNGIARFDGHDVLNINTSPYFETPVVFNFFEETPHKIWVNTKDNKLYWFNPLDNHFEFHPYKYNDILSSTIKSFYYEEYIRRIHFSKNNTLKLTFLKGTGYIEINEKGILKVKNRINPKYNSHRTSKLTLFIDNDFYYTFFTKGNPLQFWVNQKNDLELITPNFCYSQIWLYGISDTKQHKNNRYFLISKYLIRINNDTIDYLILPSEGLDLHIDKKTFLVTTFNGVYEISDSFKIKSHFLKDKIVTSVLRDNENGLWFSTLSKGIFYSPNFNLKKNSNFKKGSVKKMFILNDYMLIIKNSSDLDIFDKNGNLIYTFSNVYYFNPNIHSKEKLPSEVIQDYNFYSKRNNLYSYNVIPQNKVLYNNDFYTVEINEKRKKNLVYVNQIETILNYETLNDSIILISSKNGFSKYNINTSKVTKLKNEVIQNIKLHKKNMILSSKDSLFLFSKINDNLHQIQSIKRPKKSSFYFENDTVLWEYGKNKLYKHVYHQSQIKSINYSNLALNNNITSLFSDSNYFWIGTKRDILKIEYNKLRQTTTKLSPNKFILDSILINQAKVKNQDTLTFISNSNINLFFKYLTFKFNQPVKFEYQLDDETWFPTNGNNLNLKDVKYGYHTLKIRGLKYGKKDVLFSKVFHVKPLFTETLWFYVLLLVLIALFFYILFKWRLNIRLKKQKEEVEKLHLELNLLSSQMNPHFMFNTINSIQLYILEKSKHQAIQYLSDFAKLLRQSLDFSFNNFILIKDEIQFLNRYIELENKRFNENFILETNFSNTVNVNSDKIPAFLLQPVIENIIQHAHYEKNKIKKIELKINKIDNFILIQIKDFGINQPNRSTKIKKHKSYGLDIIRKRLKIYNGNKYKKSDLFIFNDLKNNNGYTVTIKIYLNEYDNS